MIEKAAEEARERADRIAEAREAIADASQRPHDGVLRDMARSLARRARAADTDARHAEEKCP
jgi:hypothetical protein